MMLVLAASSYYFSTISITTLKVDNIKHTKIVLEKAKQALIAHAINYPEVNATNRGPGYFVCPDMDNDGRAELTCNGPTTIGRFPWRTLNVGDLRDSANERLWYAVSENFDYTSSPLDKKINTETIGNITVRDNSNNIIFNGAGIDGAVAVIISPGIALTRGDGIVQNRSGANLYNATHYLDIDTTSIPAEDNDDFVQGVFGGTNVNGFIQGEIFDAANNIIVNDLIEVITYNDIMKQVHKRVSQEISNLISEYFTACNAYPEASAFDPSKTDFSSEDNLPLELREGHLPLDSAQPVDWDTGCATGIEPMPWLSAEAWQSVTYYAFAFQNAPPTNVYTCGSGTNPPCMIINSVEPLINTTNAQAIIMFSGRDTAIGGSRPSSDMSDYFEGENNSLNNIFDADEVEDFIRVITP